MKTDLRIAGIGEILLDLFEDGTATVGGAPVNVAYHAHQLLTARGRGRGEVVSAVGDDRWGKYLLEWLKAAGISSRWVAVDARFATGSATVFVRDGEAGYEIAPEAAWDHLSESSALQELAGECSAVAFGSLAQRNESSGQAIRSFVAGVNGHRLYDVNLRVNATDGVQGYNATVLRKSCSVATIVKANSAELNEVARLLGLPSVQAQGEPRLWAQMEQLLAAYELFAVVITRGAQGTFLLGRHGRLQLADSTQAAADVHPVGAGDAFSAGLLYGLCLGCRLEASARIADRLASWVTHYSSATPECTPELLAELRLLEHQERVS